jgi:hypothetical protein
LEGVIVRVIVPRWPGPSVIGEKAGALGWLPS